MQKESSVTLNELLFKYKKPISQAFVRILDIMCNPPKNKVPDYYFTASKEYVKGNQEFEWNLYEEESK